MSSLNFPRVCHLVYQHYHLQRAITTTINNQPPWLDQRLTNPTHSNSILNIDTIHVSGLTQAREEKWEELNWTAWLFRSCTVQLCYQTGSNCTGPGLESYQSHHHHPVTRDRTEDITTGPRKERNNSIFFVEKIKIHHLSSQNTLTLTHPTSPHPTEKKKQRSFSKNIYLGAQQFNCNT